MKNGVTYRNGVFEHFLNLSDFRTLTSRFVSSVSKCSFESLPFTLS